MTRILFAIFFSASAAVVEAEQAPNFVPVQKPEKLAFLLNIPKRKFAILERLAHRPRRTPKFPKFRLECIQSLKNKLVRLVHGYT